MVTDVVDAAPLRFEPGGSPHGSVAARPAIVPANTAVRTAALSAVGPVVDRLYPFGFAKLARRYEDAVAGRARGHVVLDRGRVCGYAMESPKSDGAIKLSTVWIDPRARGTGVGRGLVSSLMLDWLESDVSRVYVTARVGVADLLVAAFSPLGFEVIAHAFDRYGDGKDEAILEWRPGRAPQELWLRFFASRFRSGTWPHPGRVVPSRGLLRCR